MKKTIENILITGGGGFVGSNLILNLQDKYKITCLDRGSTYSELKKFTNKNVKLIKGNISNEFLVDKLIKCSDKIIHLAGGGGNEAAKHNSIWAIDTHILGTYNLLQKSLKYKIKQFIFASSCFVYSSLKENKLRVTESSLLEPDSFYGILKKTAEALIKESDIYYTILRFSNIYGSFHLKSLPNQGAIYKFIKAGIDDQSIEIYGSGKQLVDYINIQDVISSINLILNNKSKNNTYNIGSGSLISIEELARLISKIFKNEFQKKIKIKKISVPAHKVSFAPSMSIEKIKKDCKWSPKIGLEKGIKDIILSNKNK